MLPHDQMTRAAAIVAVSVTLAAIAVDRRVRRGERILAALCFGLGAFVSMIACMLLLDRLTRDHPIPGFQRSASNWGQIGSEAFGFARFALLAVIPFGIGLTIRARMLRRLQSDPKV